MNLSKKFWMLFIIIAWVLFFVLLFAGKGKSQTIGGKRVYAYLPDFATSRVHPENLDFTTFTHPVMFGWQIDSTLKATNFTNAAFGTAESLYFTTGLDASGNTPFGQCGYTNCYGANKYYAANHSITNLKLWRDSTHLHGGKLLMGFAEVAGTYAANFNALIDHDTLPGGMQDIVINQIVGFKQRNGYDGYLFNIESPDQTVKGQAYLNRFFWKLRSVDPTCFICFCGESWLHWGTNPPQGLIPLSSQGAIDDYQMEMYGMEGGGGNLDLNSPLHAAYPNYYPNNGSSLETWDASYLGPEWLIKAGWLASKISVLLPNESKKFTYCGAGTIGAATCSPWKYVGNFTDFQSVLQFAGVTDVSSNLSLSPMYHWNDSSKCAYIAGHGTFVDIRGKGTVTGNVFITVEDSVSLYYKAQRIFADQLGGTGTWELFSGYCWNLSPPWVEPQMRWLASALVKLSGITPPPPALTNTIKASALTDTIGQQITFIDNLNMTADSIVYYRSAVGSTPVRVTSTTNTSTWAFYWTGVATGSYGSYTVAYKNGVGTNSNTITIPVYNPYVPPPPATCYNQHQLDSAYAAGKASVVCPPPVDTTGTAAFYYKQGWNNLLNLIPSVIDTSINLQILVPKPPIK